MSLNSPDIKELEALYCDVYNITVEISSIINLENLEKIEELLNAKSELIKEINSKKDLFPDSEKVLIKEYVSKIKDLDEKNIERMEEIFNGVKRELSSISVGKKAISAYKFNKTIEPRLFDTKQ